MADVKEYDGINENDYVGYGIDKTTGKRHKIEHLPENAFWETGVYQYEQNDKLIGGIDGIDNLQAQALVNRTAYLKEKQESQATRIEEVAQIAEEAKEEAEQGGGSASVLTVPITIPITGWNDCHVGDYFKYVEIEDETITAEMTPQLIFAPEYMKAAQAVGIGEACETLEGKLCIYAMEIPAAAIPATLCLFGASGGISPTGLPIATKTRAGIVKVGENIDVTSDGTISVPALSDADGNGIPDVIDGASATDEEVDEMLDEVYGKS